jgi:hypothetical protein
MRIQVQIPQVEPAPYPPWPERCRIYGNPTYHRHGWVISRSGTRASTRCGRAASTARRMGIRYGCIPKGISARDQMLSVCAR